MIANQLEHSDATSRALPVLVVLQCSMLSAIAVVLGQSFAIIPNVEFITVIIFVAGTLGGFTGGVVTAITTTISFNYLNPLGPALPMIMAAQALGWSLTALGGSLFARFFAAPITRRKLAAAGFLLTLPYEILVNLAFFLIFGENLSMSAFFIVFWAALPFSLVHIISNTLIFHIVGKSLMEVIERSGSSR